MTKPLQPRHRPALALRLALLGAGSLALHGAPALAAGQEPTVESLQKEVEARDAVIRDLLRRVEKLEKQATSQLQPPAPAGKGRKTASASASPAVPVVPLPQPPPTMTAQAASPPDSPSAPSPAPDGAAQSAPAQAASQGPGQFEVDKEAAERALERALVQTGALLLPPGVAEAVPSLAYIRRETVRADQIVLTTTGQLLASQDTIKSDEVDAGTLLRVGLPWEMQAEINLPPAVYKKTSTSTQAAGAALSEQTTDATGFGDPTFTLIKGLTHEGEWRPSTFASIGWSADLGQTEHGIPLGNGFNELSATLTAAKRQDPLVFIAGLGYTRIFEKDDVKPGDQYSASGQILFAVSPETSLQFGPKLTFANDTMFRGTRLPGTHQLAGAFSAGMLSILAPGLVLNLTADIGFTHDAPAFDLKLQLPFRFDLGV